MQKLLIPAAAALTIGLSAQAQTTPLAGDMDFLAEAYAEAEDGRTFSYASQWGNGKAYDGTDTSGTLTAQAPIVRTSAQAAPAPVRRQAPATQPQTYIQRPQPAPRTMPASTQAPRPVVNTMRTVTKPAAPTMRGTTGSQTVVSRPAPTPLGDLPQANPGECYARMKVAAQYDRVPRQISVAAPYQRAKLSQAQFSTEVEKVIVKEAHTRYVVTEPKFAVRHEQLTVKPAHDRLEVVPAKFSYVAETVQVSEPRLVWKRGAGLSGVSRTDPRTGDTWCLVEQAGETKTMHKRIVSQPEQVRRVPVAAQTLTVPRQVLVQPGGIKQIEVPAEYRDFNVQRLLKPASSGSYDVPAEVDTVMTKVLKSPERFEWVPVLCDTNSGPETIMALQSALQQRGLYGGRVDGVMGPQTRAALVQYQRSAGIAHLGYLTTATMGSLGLS